MKFDIVKAESGTYCLHPTCKKDARYVTPKGRIKKNSIAAKISCPIKGRKWKKEEVFYYCRTCIDQILLDCRANLDAKLWVFK